MDGLIVTLRQLVVPQLLVVIFTAGSLAQQPATDLPPAYHPRKQQVDVKHIALNLKFDWQHKQAYGTAITILSPLTATDTLTLDAVQLAIEAITLPDGTPVRYSYNEQDAQNNLTLFLNKTYSTTDTLTVSIHYHTQWINATDPANTWGSTGKGIRFFKPSSTEPNRKRQIWSMGEGEGNRYWFPCFDAPGDVRTTDFIATVEKPFTVVANGVLVDAKDNADDSRTIHYRADLPYPNHKTAFVMGEYVDVQKQQGQTTLHNYAYPDEKDATTATIERLPDMVRFFSELTGKPYPSPTYTQAFVQELPWGYAGSGLSIQTENMVDDYRTHADYLYLWDMLEGESLASQWFGNSISCRDWRHYWLDKAFSRYFSCLYNEHKNGKDEFLLYQLTFDQANYFTDWTSGTRHPVVTDRVSDVNAFISENYPNSRGALVLHMLRKQLGEEKWRKVIRYYVQANAGKSVTTSDFEQAIQVATGDSLHWFFDQWIYKMGHPIFEIKKQYNSATKQLALIVKQIQQPDSGSAYPQITYFRGRMDVEIDERIEPIAIEPKRENVFSFSCVKEPKLVNVDYESAWIKEIRFEKSLNELCYQLQHDKDILGKRWAVNELVRHANVKNTSVEDRQKIYEAFRNLILSNSYWRIRFNAIGSLQNMYLSAAGTNQLVLDKTTTDLLRTIIKRDSAWVRSAAINFLGLTRDVQYAGLYISLLNDKSERVTNAAAIALGRSKSPQAFDALIRLKDKPSWKNQSLISSLNGLKELGDKRAVEFALPYINASHLPHWTLSTPIWDHRLAASETIVALGAADKAYPIVLADFNKAMQENNTNDIFYQVQQIATLADARGQEVFNRLKEEYKENPNAIIALTNLEDRFKEALKAN